MAEPRLILDGPGPNEPTAGAEYSALIGRLYALSKSGSRFGLEPLARVLEALGHPEKRFPAIHIAGSNGKGSTAAFCAHLLSDAGYRVGLYTSPHLRSLRERIQILRPRGAPEAIDEGGFVAACAKVEQVAPEFGELTFFEAITAAAIVHFSEARLDVAVIEAGLGARLDATRLVQAEVAVLTDLALEHREILGDTLEAIAAEKAHVIRGGRPLVCTDGEAAAMAVIDRHAAGEGARVLRLGQGVRVSLRADHKIDLELDGGARCAGLELGLLGPHQARNAALAAQAALCFEPGLNEGALRSGLARTRWPGRMERFFAEQAGPVLLDGAHNGHGARALAAGLLAHADVIRGPRHFVIGALADKDAGALLHALLPLAASFTFTRPASPRARPPGELLALVPDRAWTPCRVIESPERALGAARAEAAKDKGWVIACGSLYLVGELRSLLD